MAKVDPAAWRDAGEVFRSEATRFSTAARREFAPLATTAGVDGIPVLDEMIAGVLPAVMEAVNATVDGISANLAAEGTALVERGDALQEIRAEIEEWDDEDLS